MCDCKLWRSWYGARDACTGMFQTFVIVSNARCYHFDHNAYMEPIYRPTRFKHFISFRLLHFEYADWNYASTLFPSCILTWQTSQLTFGIPVVQIVTLTFNVRYIDFCVIISYFTVLVCVLKYTHGLVFPFRLSCRLNTMMASWQGSIICNTGPLRGKPTGHRWVPLPKGQ